MRTVPPPPTLAEIRELLAERGVSHVGVASADVLADTRRELVRRRDAGLHDGMGFTYRDPERATDPGRAVRNAKSVIVAAAPYLSSDEVPPPSGSGPYARVAKYAWVDHYSGLRSALREVCHLLKLAGHRATAFADDNSMVDRAIAHRGGLGWFGKNANLLLPGAGSFFVLGSIVTTAEYEPAAEPEPDACGTCRRCIDGCPTGAIVEPGVIDAARCLSWVLQKPGTLPLEFRRVIGDRIYGCDDCQDVCPISVRLGARNTVDVGDDPVAWVDAAWLLAATDDQIEQRCGRWYVADRDMRWVRRNAAVVCGNIGDPADVGLRAALDSVRRSGDEVLAEHAVWALDELDRRAAEHSEVAVG